MDINEYSTENNWEIIKNQTCPYEFDSFGEDLMFDKMKKELINSQN